MNYRTEEGFEQIPVPWGFGLRLLDECLWFAVSGDLDYMLPVGTFWQGGYD